MLVSPWNTSSGSRVIGQTVENLRMAFNPASLAGVATVFGAIDGNREMVQRDVIGMPRLGFFGE